MATDVQLLRNRVRMLQQEHERAQKKIKETSKKTEELVDIRRKNDVKFENVTTQAIIQNINTRLEKPLKDSNFYDYYVYRSNMMLNKKRKPR